MTWLDVPATRLLVALAVGLLIGVERERRKAERGYSAFAGLRTFGLVGLLGGLFVYVDQVALLVAGAVLVTAFGLAAYVVDRKRPEDLGMTTEVALLVTYALGALSVREPVLGGGLAVVVASLLALRGFLHRVVRETLSQAELRDGLSFLLLALVVLPIVPDLAIGPYDAIHPAAIARLIVLLTALSGFGYVAQRMLGPRFGALVSGFSGGFISSSATIAACGMRVREDSAAWRVAAVGALASSVATVFIYGLLVAAADPALLAGLAWPLGLALLAALAGTLAMFWGAPADREAQAPRGRAFRLWLVVALALGVTLLSLVAAALQHRLGSAGVVLAASVSGLVDAHAASGSVAALHHAGNVDSRTAVFALVSALSANTVTKIAMAAAARHWPFVLSVSAGVLAIAAAAWLGVWIDS